MTDEPHLSESCLIPRPHLASESHSQVGFGSESHSQVGFGSEFHSQVGFETETTRRYKFYVQQCAIALDRNRTL